MGNFDKYNETFNTSSGSASAVYTGLTATKVLGINPNREQLKKIIGDGAEKFNVKYEVEDNPVLGAKTRPLVMWLQDKNEKVSPFIFQTNLGKDLQKSKSGNVKVINSKLQDTWGASKEAVIENPKMSWFSQTGIRETRIGEFEYYKFLATLLRFDFNNESVNFFEMCADLDLDFDKVLSGDYSGLHSLVEYINKAESEKYIGLVFAAKQKQDGNYRQDILWIPELFYRTGGEISEGQIINFEEKCADKEAEGYPYAASKEFSSRFKEFTASTPKETVSPETTEINNIDDWIS